MEPQPFLEITGTNVDQGGVMPVLIAQRAKESPDVPFLFDVSGHSMTFGELHTSAVRWAEALDAAGVHVGTAVGSMLPNSVEHYPIWLAVGWLRGLEVPINVELRGGVLRHVLHNSGAQVLVVHADIAQRMADLEDDLPELRLIVVTGGRPPAAPGRWPTVTAEEFLRDHAGVTTFPSPRPEDVSSILYTSGTTGPSKGVVVPWAQLHSGSMVTTRFSTQDGADRFYVCGSPSHVTSKGAFATMALTRGRLYVRPAFSLNDFWSDVRRFGIRSTVLVGAMADFLLAPLPSPDDLDNTVENILMCPVTTRVKEFNERFGTRVWTAYNMTETSVPIASDTWTEDARSCGRLRSGYPFYEARLVDESDNEVPDGQVGELMIRTAVPWTLNGGYLNMPDATARAWRNGWFHTGDAFRRDVAGDYFFVDRMKDTIRRRGENISSFEVEAEVLRHPDIAECAAVAVPADEVEDEIKVAVVLRQGARFDPRDLVEFLRDRVPRYMIPRYVEIVAELPKTQTFRVQKTSLRTSGTGPGVWDRMTQGDVCGGTVPSAG